MTTVETALGIPAAGGRLSKSGSTASKHPELSIEVAMLSDKLIHAINHQTTLDDTLVQTRQELEASRARIQQLEAEAKEHETRMSSGPLLTKAEADVEKSKLMADLAEERRQKQVVHKEKRSIESELETLTASLFEEANRMVATANQERDAMEKKNQQLRDQIKDTEVLLASQHEQLTELKTVMQHMSTESAKDEPGASNAPSAPSSPAVRREESSLSRLLEAMNLTPISSETGDVPPAPSTSFTYLIKPVCRTDLPAYEDFRNFVNTSQKSHPPSRINSGSYSGLNVMGLSSIPQSQPLASRPSTSSNASSTPTGPQGPPGSFSSNSAEAKAPPPLRETKLYKRLLVEDIEPTLRMDLSSSISWLSRRSVISALTDGTLIVEPIPEASMKLYGRFTSCGLCGEARKEQVNPRAHRMQVGEGENATRWALCTLCLEKVRSVGDLAAFVRMVRDGVVRCGDAEEEKEAWEELIRLRERLFWARMAGGVVPAFLRSEKDSSVVKNESHSSRDSLEASRVGPDARPQRQVPESSTPIKARKESSDSMTQEEADRQLNQGLQESLTTFDNIKKRPQSTTPATPPKRESGGFLRVNIPSSFWNTHVNVLH